MLIDNNILLKLTKEAQRSQRLRKNYNLHETFEDGVQRMFNAIEPKSIFPIARHQNAAETIIIIKGAIKISIYDDNKSIIEEVILNNAIGNYCYHIPKGVWHKAEALQNGTVIFETKEGPYKQLCEMDILK